MKRSHRECPLWSHLYDLQEQIKFLYGDKIQNIVGAEEEAWTKKEYEGILELMEVFCIFLEM